MRQKKKRQTILDLYNEEKEKPTPSQEFVSRLAKHVDKSEHTIRQWIYGNQEPDSANKDKISELLGIPVETLFPTTSKIKAQ